MADVDSRLCRFIGALLLVCPVLVCQKAQAETVTGDHNHLEIAYIYNIGKFTDWPAATFVNQRHFNICFYGNVGALAHSMQAFNGKTIKGNPLKSRTIKRGEKINGCHILYVSHSEAAFFPTIIQSLRGQAVLTISRSESWTQYGGMIGFAKEKKSLVFNVNNKAIHDANLNLSANVLRLARKVIK